MVIKKLDAAEATKITYNKTATKYAESHFDFSTMKKQYKDFMSYCKSGMILDVGCGPGRDVKYFMTNGYQVIGIDNSDGMIKEAKRRVPEGDFQKLDMRSLDFDGHTFDGVWACASVLHIPKSKVRNVLEGFKRILKPKGILYITVKRGEGEGLEEREGGNKKFFAYYTEYELKNILKEIGFRILKFYLNKNEKDHVFINVFAKSV